MEVYLAVLSGTIFLVSGQTTPNPECNYEQDVVPDQTYYIFSPRFSDEYPENLYCRWFARAPTSYKITITCSVNMPYSDTCPQDRLLVSETGETTDFHTYCGIGTFTSQSQANNMLIELHVPESTAGGSFNCTLFTQTKPPPPPVCDCGWKKESRIVNGQETGVNEYPMMVGLIDVQIRELVCGGTIISNKYILTAAHCLLNKIPENVGILVGDHDISTATDTSSSQLLKAELFIGHPDYDSANQVNDIALIRVVDYIYYSLEVGPACLPFRYPDSPDVGQSVVVLGWGTLEPAGPKSNVLMKTTLDVIDITTCEQNFGSHRVSENQICTFRQGTDACQADSGGPVLNDVPDDRVWLEGIISYGKSCALQYPGVNTRVGKYLQWILQSTLGESYCVR